MWKRFRGRFVLFLLIAFSAFCAGKQSPPDLIRIAVRYEPDTFDPHLSTTASNFAVLSHFYEPLVMMDDSMKVIPWLAERWETRDAKTWIFHLRRAVSFHSGKAFTSADVVYSFRRILENKNFESAAYLRSITDVSAIDPYTVKVVTDRPVALLLNRLRHILIVPQNTQSLNTSHFVDGTGSYLLEHWRPGRFIKMLRNEKYWGRKPEAQQVEMLLALTPEKVLSLLKSGSCDLAQANSRRMENEIQNLNAYRILRQDGIFLKLLSYDTYRSVTPHCNVTPNPFKNKNVREAIHLAIDRTNLVEELSTPAIPASQPVPSLIFGHNPGIQVARADLQQARRLLHSAGLPDGFSVSLHVRNLLKEPAELVQQQLGRIGVRVHLILLNDEEFFREIAAGNVSLYLNQFGCSTGDAGEVLSDAMHSVDPKNRLGMYNAGRYENIELDRMIEQLELVEEPSFRQNMLQSGMAEAMKELVWIPLYTDQEIYVIHQKLNWKPRADGDVLAAEIRFR